MKLSPWLLCVFACATPAPEPPTSLRAVAPASQGAALSAPTPTSAPTRTSRCASIEAVLEAQIYRGTPPKSQSQLDAESAYQGDFVERDDHFMKYLKCAYRVNIKGSRYTFDDYTSGVTIQDDLETSMCEGRREEVERDIEGFTRAQRVLRKHLNAREVGLLLGAVGLPKGPD